VIHSETGAGVVSQSASLNVALAVQTLAGFLDELNRVSPTVQLEASEHLIIWIRKKQQ